MTDSVHGSVPLKIMLEMKIPTSDITAITMSCSHVIYCSHVDKPDLLVNKL